MIQLITITGTESTGKTELAQKLAAHYKTVFVPDYSRQYVERLNRKYNHSDVVHIARAIIEAENNMLRFGHRVLFSDNCLINIKIWLQYYKWYVPDWLSVEITKRKSNFHLLCGIDVKWVEDELRKNPHDREELFRQFQDELDYSGIQYRIIQGTGNRRTQNAIQAVDDFFKSAKIPLQ